MNSDETIEMLYDFQAGDPNHFGRWAEDEVYDGINTAIAALQAYQPWVSVEDRLPTDDGLFLVFVHFKDNPNNFKMCKPAYFIKDHWYIDRKVRTTITHWKPLPEIPKGE